MKTVIIGPVYPYRGGISHHSTLMAQSLELAGHQVTVISFRRQYITFLYPGETDRDTSKYKLELPALYLLDPLYPWTWVKAASQIAREKPDIVIIQWWTPFWAPAFAALARLIQYKNILVVFLVHNVMPHETKFWDRWLCKAALSGGSQYIVQTEKEAARLKSLLPHARIVKTPHPIYAMFSGQQSITKKEARERLELSPFARVLLFFGIVRPYKGLRYLLETIALLRKSGREYFLLIAGEFWEDLNQYSAQIKNLGIQDQVKIFNYYIPNEDLPVFFSAADIFVAPYIDCTQSGAAKMALGFNLPIVISRCVVDETLSQRSNVWAVPERDAQALADGIEAAFANIASGEACQPENDWNRLVQAIESIHRMGEQEGI